MKNFKTFINFTSNQFLSVLATIALITAQIGAGTSSSWNFYQPTLPDELSR